MLNADRPGFPRRPAAKPELSPPPLTAEQALLVRQFVARVGGIENARRALELLAALRRVA